MRHLTMTRQCQHSSPCWSKPAPKIDLYLWDTSHQYIVDQNLVNNQNHPIIIIITNTVDQNLICDWFWIPSISMETDHRPCGLRYKARGFEQIASSQMYFQRWQIISLLRRLCLMPRVWLICLSSTRCMEISVHLGFEHANQNWLLVFSMRIQIKRFPKFRDFRWFLLFERGNKPLPWLPEENDVWRFPEVRVVKPWNNRDCFTTEEALTRLLKL